MPDKQKPTIVEGADVATVSWVTVSRDVHNDPKVAAATLTRVQAAMAELGYVPLPPKDRFRRPSRRKHGIRTENIALLIPDPRAETTRTPISASLAHWGRTCCTKGMLWRMRHPHEAQRKILIKPELVRDGVTAMARQ